MHHYIKELRHLESVIPDIMSQRNWGFDTETTGLDPLTDKILLLQIGNIHTQYVIDMRTLPITPLIPFLESRSVGKVGHNAKFDYKMIRGNYGMSTEYITDTYYAEKILSAGRKLRGFALNDLSQQYLGRKIDKSIRASFGKGYSGGEFTREQIQYAAQDVEIILPILEKQISLMTNGMLKTWALECAALPCFADMEFDGMPLDTKKWLLTCEENQKKIIEIEEELTEITSQILSDEGMYINWSSPDQVLKVLNAFKLTIDVFDYKSKSYKKMPLIKSDDKILQQLKDVPLVRLLRKHRSLRTRVNTFGEQYVKAVSPITGRLHPEYDQIGAETGRPTNKTRKDSVNVLNIPKDPAYRECFICEPDEIMETHDYSVCETRIWAEISGDPKLIDAFQRGIDVHCYVASMLFGREVVKGDPERAVGKHLNFGVCYGMKPKTFCMNLNAYNFPITLEEATKKYNAFNKEFLVGVDFIRSMGRLACSQGYLDNLGGRRRYFVMPNPTDNIKFPLGLRDPKYNWIISAIENSGGNFMVQSVNADITKRAMIKIRDHIKKNKIRSKFVNQVYDEIITRTHKDDHADFTEIKKNIMIDAAHHYLKKVPMEVDTHVGPHWIKG